MHVIPNKDNEIPKTCFATQLSLNDSPDDSATIPPMDSSYEQSPPPSPTHSTLSSLSPSPRQSRALSPPTELNEGFLCDPSVLDMHTGNEQDETMYHLVREGTIHGNMKLVTTDGYSFNIRRRRPNGTIDWQCTVRSKVRIVIMLCFTRFFL